MDGPGALLTGYQASVRGDFRNTITEAYDRLFDVSPELEGRSPSRYAYEYARDEAGLDFLALSPHVATTRAAFTQRTPRPSSTSSV